MTVTLTEWRRRIDTALIVGLSSDADIVDSANWQSCAVGERYRKEYGNHLLAEYMLTPTARNLGADFYRAIQNNEPERALEILEAIEGLKKILA